MIEAGEMVGKIKAALDARHDQGTLIVARTDALGVNGLDDALERANRYLEAGADLLFIEAPKTVQQMQSIADQFARRVPLVHNLVEGGGSPTTDTAKLQQLGYRVALYPVALLHNFVPRARQVLAEILGSGNTEGLRDQMCDLADMNALLGADQLLASGKKYQG